MSLFSIDSVSYHIGIAVAYRSAARATSSPNARRMYREQMGKNARLAVKIALARRSASPVNSSAFLVSL